jgi:hypothetical protein
MSFLDTPPDRQPSRAAAVPQLLSAGCPSSVSRHDWRVSRPAAGCLQVVLAAARSLENALCISFYVTAVVKPSCVFFLCSLSAVFSRPERFRGFLGCWHLVVQRPSPRAGVNTFHLSLAASRDDSQHAGERRPHRYDDLRRRSGMPTDYLRQHYGTGLAQHRHIAAASLRTVPDSATPVLRTRHSAMSNLSLRRSGA